MLNPAQMCSDADERHNTLRVQRKQLQRLERKGMPCSHIWRPDLEWDCDSTKRFNHWLRLACSYRGGTHTYIY